MRLELRARDAPDQDIWAAERNGDLFELEFGRRVQPVAVEVTSESVRRSGVQILFAFLLGLAFTPPRRAVGWPGQGEVEDQEVRPL